MQHRVPRLAGPRTGPLTILIEEARERRRERRLALLRASRDPSCEVQGGTAARRRRASTALERMLRAPLPPLVDCSRYFGRVMAGHQLASDAVAELMLSVQSVKLDAGTARALAAALIEFLGFVDGGVPRGGAVRVYLAVVVDDEYLIVGLGVEGSFACLATERATAAMLCGARIVRALGGEFQRGVDGGRMVFGVTLPPSIVRAA